MDCCPFAKRSGSKTRDHPGGSVPGGWRKRLAGGRIDAFTLLELIILVAIVGILCGIAAPIYADFRYKAQVEVARATIREIEAGIHLYYYKKQIEGKGKYPETLSEVMEHLPFDPWGNPYQYLSSTDANWSAGCRRDRYMNPLNNDFDLFSKGRDGDSRPSLTHLYSRDDVIRGRNGAFVGLGKDY